MVEGQQGKQIAFACACACVALELCEPVFNLNGLKFAFFFHCCVVRSALEMCIGVIRPARTCTHGCNHAFMYAHIGVIMLACICTHRSVIVPAHICTHTMQSCPHIYAHIGTIIPPCIEEFAKHAWAKCLFALNILCTTWLNPNVLALLGLCCCSLLQKMAFSTTCMLLP